ncbi:uncharacterized protein B0T15DRAFT_106438 [Chaetomium strumarium]|uniref:F-box domain-containing protein n=1 Tax=Chaetomium strumarium TaxID=1170767 RepID=A0AAJ0GYB4_9PEZI|nr:hypothetical protein B0T15DRAFT_106438 [Chaetomium strumarium]
MSQRVDAGMVADDRGARGVLNDAEPETETAQQPQEESRSTSSSTSPVPPDNEESDFFLAADDSQSSLGMPNLQDMHVSDDECIQPIDRLPNELLIAIFARLNTPSDLLNVMLVCKRWSRNAVDLLWHRPSCTTWKKHESICRTLALENPYFAYRDFVKRLNLSALAGRVNDGSVMPLAACTRVERLTLTGCANLTDLGVIALVSSSSRLYSLDVSMGPSSTTADVAFNDQISETSIYAIAKHCPRLQGLNVSGCRRISNESLIQLARNCRQIKRLKFNNCTQITDEAVLAFAENCPNILELDLHQCREIGNEPVSRVLTKGKSLRELHLANCDLVDDSAFLSLPPNRTYENLRILNLGSCTRLTDRAVEKIVEVAPRLRNLVLQKCRNITDVAVYAISKLGKNLHYLHLGHCGHITDDAVKRLVNSCNRIRYIDLGCCTLLTDDSVTKLAALPKLKRIGLVKCSNITDASVLALANANRRPRMRRDASGNIIGSDYSTSQSCLERVHLSYCTNLTQDSIIKLLNSCPRLTHLSLTGVQAFLREDLEGFSRDAPPEFTEHQRAVFCVFSGQGVVGLRKHLNRIRQAPLSIRAAPPVDGAIFPDTAPPPAGLPNLLQVGDGGFDDGEVDAIDDDDGLEDASEMVLDTHPLLNNQQNTVLDFNAALGTIPLPPPAAQTPQPEGTETPFEPFHYVAGHPPYIPVPVTTPGEPATLDTPIAAAHQESSRGQEEGNGDVADNDGTADTASSPALHPQSAVAPGPTTANVIAAEPNHSTPIHHAHMDISTPGAVILEQQRLAANEHQASHSGGPAAA